MNKYQVGDKVRVRRDLRSENFYGKNIFEKQMIPYLGKTLTIKKTIFSGYEVKENNWGWTDEMFEGKVENMFTKKDLETGMLVTCRNGQKYVVMRGMVKGKCKKDVGIKKDDWIDLENCFNDDLLCNAHIYDIVKVEKLVNWNGCHRILSEYIEENFDTVWEREEKQKEINLTVAIIRHSGVNKSYWFKVPNNVKVQRGQTVLVDTARGKDTGWVKQVLKFKTQSDLDEYIKNNQVVGPTFPLKEVIGIVKKQ